MTSPVLPLPLANATPASNATSNASNAAAARDKRDAFAQTLARQQAASHPQSNSSQACQDSAAPQGAGQKGIAGEPAQAGAAQEEDSDLPQSAPVAATAEQTAWLAAADATAALPRQALEIASQVAEIQARVGVPAAQSEVPEAAAQAPANDPLPTAALPGVATQAAVAIAPAAAQVPQGAAASVARPAPSASAPLPAAPATPAPAASPAAQAPVATTLALLQDTLPAPERAADSAIPAGHTGAFMPPTQTLASASMPAPQIGLPVGASQWGQELGRELVRFSHSVQHGTHTAELRLDPPDLGPLRVTLSMIDGVASASFVSAHAAVRQAVEAALPQLQQALADAGIALGQANVGNQDQAQQQGGHGRTGMASAAHSAPGSDSATPSAASAAPATTPARHDGLINTYA